MDNKMLENLFEEYKKEGEELQKVLNEKHQLISETQNEITKLEFSLATKRGNLEALQTLYAKINESETEEPKSETEEVVETEAVEEN